MSERQRTAQAIYDAAKRATVPIVVAQPCDGAIKAFATLG